MKKLGILLLACITALNLWAEEFKIGKLTFKIATPTTVELIDADKDIGNVFLSETINYEGKSYTLTSIEDFAFNGCSSLASVTIPNSVTSIGWGAFEGCESLTSVTIPNSVTWIGYGAFKGCSSLTSVSIPNSVTSIGWGAFEDCSSLTSVTIPNSVTSIGESAFKGTALYENPANWENGALYIDDCLIKVDVGFAGHFRIKENTRVISDKAFAWCYSLTSVTIPNSVTSFGDEAFVGSALYENPANWENGALYIDNCLIGIAEDFAGHFRIKENTRVISDRAFSYCESLTSVTIPNSVTSIGEGAFYACYSLTSVTIPNSVTSIGNRAFVLCHSLTSVTIPNSVTSIGEAAFAGCWSLTSVTIPNSVRSIEDWAFKKCFALTSITIPNSVTSIGEEAFGDCSSLKSVTIPNSVTSIGEGAFPSHTQIIRQ